MSEWDWVFFYNEEHNNVESVTTYHQQQCDIGSLAEAHPEKIYFYARFSPLLEWDFNEVAYAPADPDHPPLFEYGVDHATLFTVPDMRVISIDIHEGPNAFGKFIEVVETDGDGEEPS